MSIAALCLSIMALGEQKRTATTLVGEFQECCQDTHERLQAVEERQTRFGESLDYVVRVQDAIVGLLVPTPQGKKRAPGEIAPKGGGNGLPQKFQHECRGAAAP
jgi:hypothetical protein